MRFLPLLLLCALGCGDSGAETNVPTPDDGILWEVPDLPFRVGLEIDGVAVSAVALRGFLESEWNSFVVRNLGENGRPTAAETEQLADRFLADPESLLQPLVDDLLLIRDHRERHPEIDSQAFSHYREDLEHNAGHLVSSLLDSLGEDGLREHLENKFRIRAVQQEFAAGLPSLSEAELQEAIAARAAAKEQDLAEVQQALAKHPEALEVFTAQVTADRAEAAIRDWLDEVRPRSQVVFVNRQGKRVLLDF